MRTAIALLILAACDGGTSSSGLEVQLVRPDGTNAAEGVDGTLRVEVRQAARLIPCDDGACDAEIHNGVFDLVFPIESFEEDTRAQTTIEPDPGQEIRGATPVFKPFGESIDVLGVVRIVMDVPSHCRLLTLEGVVFGDAPDFAHPHAHAAVVVRRNLALIAGGDAEASAVIDRFDM